MILTIDVGLKAELKFSLTELIALNQTIQSSRKATEFTQAKMINRQKVNCQLYVDNQWIILVIF